MQAQVLINGLVSGLILAVLALGFSLVYLPARVFHIALGGIFALTPYVALAGSRTSGSWVLAIGAALLVAVGLSVMCEAGNHRLLERKHASHGAHIISSLGLYIVIVQVVALAWGNEPQVLRVGVDKTFHLGAAMLTRSQGLAAICSAVLLCCIGLWLRFSALGLHFRALSDNSTEFALAGYNVDRYRALAFALSGLLGGVAALLMACDVGFDPHGGLHMVLLAVVAMIVGGRGSFLGPILGGLLLGLVRALVVWHLSSRWQDVVTFLILALFLYVRPNGICGQMARLEAQE